MPESKYYDFQDILNFLGFAYKFNLRNDYGYPFNQDPKNVIFSHGQILIPKNGIRQTVQNKISDIAETPLKEITMMYQIPFVVVNNNEKKTFNKYKSGVINQDIALTFRYDKQYKYGDITKSIYEVCYYIIEHATETNEFFIIPYDFVNDFFSYYIIPNQWGIGFTVGNAGPQERFYGEVPNSSYIFAKLYKCPCCEDWVDSIDNDERCPNCGCKLEFFKKGNTLNISVNDDQIVIESQIVTKETDDDRE